MLAQVNSFSLKFLEQIIFFGNYRVPMVSALPTPQLRHRPLCEILDLLIYRSILQENYQNQRSKIPLPKNSWSFQGMSLYNKENVSILLKQIETTKQPASDCYLDGSINAHVVDYG